MLKRVMPLVMVTLLLCLISACSENQLSTSTSVVRNPNEFLNPPPEQTTTTALLSPTPTPTPSPTPSPSPTPTAKEITVSFLGDCTLGQNKDHGGTEYSFDSVVGEDYAYPFLNAAELLSQDDLTLANLEGPLTSSNAFREKEIVFRGSPEYVEILRLGSIEAVNLANNHSYDYWDSGLNDTRETLEGAGILWSDNVNYAYFEVDGVKIGMAGFNFPYQMQPIYDAIDALREAGSDIVIITVHSGTERMYEPDSVGVRMAHDIIDYGADIYVGHHPHRLQPIEYYNGKYILYSLSNFVFGGQPWLTDPDTAIVQCIFTVDMGQLTGVRLNVVPYTMTTTFPGNDYCPKPYEPGSEEYDRVMKKLRWSDRPE